MLTLISDPIKFVRPLVLYESVMLLASDHSCNFGPAGAMPLPHFYFNVVIEYGSAGLGFSIDASTAAVVSIKAGGAVDLYNASAQTKIEVGDRIMVANGVAIKTARDLRRAIKPFCGTFVGRMRRTHTLTQAMDVAGQVVVSTSAPPAPSHPVAAGMVPPLAAVEAAPQASGQARRHRSFTNTSAPQVKLHYWIPFEDALENLRGLSEKPLPNGTQLRTRNGCTINLYWRGGMSIGGPELSRPEGLELVKGWTVPHGKRKRE